MSTRIKGKKTHVQFSNGPVFKWWSENQTKMSFYGLNVRQSNGHMIRPFETCLKQGQKVSKCLYFRWLLQFKQTWFRVEVRQPHESKREDNFSSREKSLFQVLQKRPRIDLLRQIPNINNWGSKLNMRRNQTYRISRPT